LAPFILIIQNIFHDMVLPRPVLQSALTTGIQIPVSTCLSLSTRHAWSETCTFYAAISIYLPWSSDTQEKVSTKARETGADTKFSAISGISEKTLDCSSFLTQEFHGTAMKWRWHHLYSCSARFEMAWSLQQKPIGLALLVFGKLACLTSFFIACTLTGCFCSKCS